MPRKNQDPVKCRLYAKAYRKRHPERAKATTKRWYEKHRQEVKERLALQRAQIKQEFVAAYGGQCACCTEANIAFLTIDHIHNDGAQERKQGLANNALFRKLKKEGWPKGRYQVLCYNCNCAKQYAGGCPHATRSS